MAPAVTTFGGGRPSYRILKFDSRSWRLYDVITVTPKSRDGRDLPYLSKPGDLHPPLQWHIRYTARALFSVPPTAPYLSPRHVSDFATAMATNTTLAKRYFEAVFANHGESWRVCEQKHRLAGGCAPWLSRYLLGLVDK